jgi:hypothetical protein
MAASLKSKGRGKSFDQIAMGSEPDFTAHKGFGSDRERKIALITTLQWYNYFTDPKSNAPYLEKYLLSLDYVKNGDKAILKKVKSQAKLIAETADPSTLKLMRMILRGWVPDAHEKLLIEQLVDRVITAATTPAPKQKSSVVNVNRISPAIRLKNRTNETVVATLEDLLDQWQNVQMPKPLDVYAMINEHDLKGPVPIKVVNEYLTTIRDELELSLTDPYFQEGYSHVTPTIIKRRIKALNKMIEDTEAKKTATVAARKPRKAPKAKTKTLGKVTAKVNYKAEAPEFKLASIDPAKVVGAKRVYLFNPRTREVHHIVSMHPDGLSFKGSSLINFDIDKSTKRRVKVEQLQVVLKKTPGQVEKMLNAQAGKVTPSTGRISKEMIIMRAVNK